MTWQWQRNLKSLYNMSQNHSVIRKFPYDGMASLICCFSISPKSVEWINKQYKPQNNWFCWNSQLQLRTLSQLVPSNIVTKEQKTENKSQLKQSNVLIYNIYIAFQVSANNVFITVFRGCLVLAKWALNQTVCMWAIILEPSTQIWTT